MTIAQYHEQEIKSVLKPPLIISNFVAIAFHRFLELGYLSYRSHAPIQGLTCFSPLTCNGDTSCLKLRDMDINCVLGQGIVVKVKSLQVSKTGQG